MHSDQCREFIHENAPSFALAEEFVASIDPGREDSIWQRFQEPSDITPLLDAWLNGEPEPSVPERQAIQPASVVSRVKHLPPVLELAFKKTHAWIDSCPEGLETVALQEAARIALGRLRGEL
jgi:hypothetical protein